MLKTAWSAALCQWTVDSLERESEEQVSLVLVIRERRHKMTWTMLVPRKGTKFFWIGKIDQLGHNRVTLRCDNEPAIEALAREIAQASPRRKPNCCRETACGRKSVQRDHGTCGWARCRPGQ